MRKFLFILVGAMAAIFVVLATNYKRLVKTPVQAELSQTRVVGDENGEDLVILDRPEDPGERAQIAEMMKQVATMDESQWAKSFSFLNNDGKQITSEELKGQPYVANFFWSECPSSCKQQTDQVRLLQQKYLDQPVRFVSITVDPEIDTPEKLTVYANAAGAVPGKWLFLTGTIDQISKIGSEMFLLGGMKRRAHPDRLCLVNADGVLVGKYDWHDADQLKALNEHIQEQLKLTSQKQTASTP